MSDRKKLWQGLSASAQRELKSRDYDGCDMNKQLATVGVDAGDLVGANKREIAKSWIPGVEIFSRTVHSQRHRGLFGEFARRKEGALAKIGLWPAQWATVRMYAQTAKGFHIHPPSIPNGKT